MDKFILFLVITIAFEIVIGLPVFLIGVYIFGAHPGVIGYWAFGSPVVGGIMAFCSENS